MLSQWTYAEILDRLEALKEYLVKLRVRRIPDRLVGVIANIKELEQRRRENRMTDLVSSNANSRVRELIWSIVEGQQFAVIFDGIHGYDPKLAKRQLVKALQGPLHPIDETNSTNVGRNTTFELLLNTMFRRVGASVTIGKEADLQIDYGGARLYIECKRPQIEQNILSNVSNARRQLRYRFKTDRGTSEVGGLVAISISKALKALDSGQNMFFVDNEEGLQQLGNDITTIRQQYPDHHNSQDDFRLIGMLYHLFTPAYVRSTGRLMCASEMHIFTVIESFQEAFPVCGARLKQLLGNLGTLAFTS